MSDRSELKKLAEAATAGDWHHYRHGVIKGGPAIKFTNGSAQQQIAMTTGTDWMRADEQCANADFIAAANPTAVLALIAEVDELKIGSLCPACEGSGEGWVSSDNGPDAHNIQVDCPECFGPGTMLGAYQAMKIQRDSQIERTLNAGGDLLFMRAERDQLKADVEALRKDAGRYRWLREECKSQESKITIAEMYRFNLVGWSGDDPDGVIDAAMIEGEQP